MINCPNCKNQELPGAYFCSECGTQLISLNFLGTHVINKPVEETIVPKESTLTLINQQVMAKKKDPAISLYLVDTGKVIHLNDRKDFTLGRMIDGQSIVPDVDLSPYDAFAQGVSRMHAALRIMNGDVYGMDLGSSNGTRLNGQKIVPHVEYSLKHGDLFVLGKMKIQVLLIR